MFKPDKRLERLYDKYNKAYFYGELPAAEVGWNDELSDTYHGMTTVFHETEGNLIYFVIALHPQLKELDRGFIKLVLLHEVCHARLYPFMRHGRRFNQEMRNLAAAGAMDDIW